MCRAMLTLTTIIRIMGLRRGWDDNVAMDYKKYPFLGTQKGVGKKWANLRVLCFVYHVPCFGYTTSNSASAVALC